jgi:hypothetical protein
MEASKTKQIAPSGQNDKVASHNLTAGLLSDRVSAPFSVMGWVEDYTSMQKKQVRPNDRRNDPSEDEIGNTASESRCDEEPVEGSKGEKKGAFAIQIQHNDPIIFDDDSVSTLTHWDRARAQETITELNDMLGSFDQNKKNQISSEETKSAEPSLLDDTEPSSKVVDISDCLQSNQQAEENPKETVRASEGITMSRRRKKMDRVKKRLSGRMKGTERTPRGDATVSIDAARHELADVKKQNGRSNPPEENILEPTSQRETSKEETEAVDETKAAKAVEETTVVEEAKAVDETKVVEEAKAVDETKVVEEAKAVDETKAVEEMAVYFQKDEEQSESKAQTPLVSTHNIETLTDEEELVLPESQTQGETSVLFGQSARKPSHRRWTSDEDGKTVSFKGDDEDLEKRMASLQPVLVSEEGDTDSDVSSYNSSSHNEEETVEEEGTTSDSASEVSISERLDLHKKRMPRYQQKGTKQKVLKGILKTPYRKPRDFLSFDLKSEGQTHEMFSLDMWFDFSVIMYAFDWCGRDKNYELVS